MISLQLKQYRFIFSFFGNFIVYLEFAISKEIKYGIFTAYIYKYVFQTCAKVTLTSASCCKLNIVHQYFLFISRVIIKKAKICFSGAFEYGSILSKFTNLYLLSTSQAFGNIHTQNKHRPPHPLLIQKYMRILMK